MLKWIFLFIPVLSFSQTVDTLHEAYAIRNTYEHVPFNGVMTNGHVYGFGLDMKYNSNGSPLPIQFTRIDYVTKAVTKVAVTNSISSNLGVVWRYIFDSTGRLYMGWNTANRYIMRFNMKGDNIEYLNLGNGFYGNNSTLAYSMLLNPNKTITIGGSSSITSAEVSVIHENGYIKKIPEVDAGAGYIINSFSDGNYVYAQSGQNPFKVYSIDTITGTKSLLITQDHSIAIGGSRNGVYVQWDGNPYHKIVDGVLTTIPPAPSSASGNVAYTETKRFPGDPGNAPIVTTFWDAEKSTLHWTINNVHDSTRLETDSIRDGISRVLPMGRNILYTASYYGGAYLYDTLTQVRTFLGNPGLNVYGMLWYNDSIVYMSGYPSGTLVEWNMNQPWTVGTYFNGSARPPSSTSNPKLIAYWHTYSEISHAYKLIKLPNGVIATMGDIIRTGNSANIAFYNPITKQVWGYNSDSMYLQNVSDIAVCGSKYVLFSTNNSNGGKPKIFKYDTELHMMVDSLDFGFRNYGQIRCTGDLLYGISLDTSNPTHQIDTTLFYKVNMSTKKLIYSTKLRATVNRVQFMPDGYIGINMTYTDGQIVPIPVAPPAGFALTRVVEAKDYYYNNNKSYITIGSTLLQNRGITNSTIDRETAEGKNQYLINWLR